MTIGSLPPDRPPDDAGDGLRLKPNLKQEETGRPADSAGKRSVKFLKSATDRLELTQNQPGNTDKQTKVTYGLEDFGRPSAIEQQQVRDGSSAVSKVPFDSSDRLETVRERIKTGFYDRPEVVEETVARLAEEVLRDTEDRTDD